MFYSSNLFPYLTNPIVFCHTRCYQDFVYFLKIRLYLINVSIHIVRCFVEKMYFLTPVFNLILLVLFWKDTYTFMEFLTPTPIFGTYLRFVTFNFNLYNNRLLEIWNLFIKSESMVLYYSPKYFTNFQCT